MVKVLIGRMSDHDPWFGEFWSAVSAIAWCCYAILHTQGLVEFAGFDLLLVLAPAWVWYASALVLPAGQLWAIRRDDELVRWCLACCMAWWWLYVAVAVTAKGIDVPSVVFYYVGAAQNLYSVLRLRPRLRLI